MPISAKYHSQETTALRLSEFMPRIAVSLHNIWQSWGSNYQVVSGSASLGPTHTFSKSRISHQATLPKPTTPQTLHSMYQTEAPNDTLPSPSCPLLPSLPPQTRHATATDHGPALDEIPPQGHPRLPILPHRTQAPLVQHHYRLQLPLPVLPTNHQHLTLTQLSGLHDPRLQPLLIPPLAHSWQPAPQQLSLPRPQRRRILPAVDGELVSVLQ